MWRWTREKVVDESEKKEGGKEEKKMEEEKRKKEERIRRKMEEREEKEEREREEEERRRKRERNVVWGGIVGKDREERRMYVENVAKSVLGRKVDMGRVEERGGGEAGKWVIIAEIGRKVGRTELLNKEGKIRRRWGIGVDEELSMEERRMK